MRAPSSGQRRPGWSKSMPSSERGTCKHKTEQNDDRPDGHSETQTRFDGRAVPQPLAEGAWPIGGEAARTAPLPSEPCRRRVAARHRPRARTWEVDGFSQLWFDDVDAMRRAVASPELRPDLPDIANFCADVKLVFCQPNVVVPVAADAGPLVKRMSILTRRPDITAERFRDEWFGFHAEAVRKFPNLMGYTSRPKH